MHATAGRCAPASSYVRSAFLADHATRLYTPTPHIPPRNTQLLGTGQAYASAKELSFSWMSLTTAMSSNVAFALRAILAKISMSSSAAKKLTTANLFAVVNMLAFALTAPLALALEAPGARASWQAALSKGTSSSELVKLILATGVTYYLYNEFAFLCLGKVDPVTHAVANTIKRVAVIAVSILYFKNPITKEGMLGSAVAVVGVLLYSLALDAEKAAAPGAAKLAKCARGKCGLRKEVGRAK